MLVDFHVIRTTWPLFESPFIGGFHVLLVCWHRLCQISVLENETSGAESLHTASSTLLPSFMLSTSAYASGSPLRSIISPVESAVLLISASAKTSRSNSVLSSSNFQGRSNNLLSRSSSWRSNLKPRGGSIMGNSSVKNEPTRASGMQSGEPVQKVHVSNEEWRKKLTPEQYRVARGKGTERPFSGELNGNKRQGTYHCICCDTPLFSSSAKFDSGTGWPSFFETIGSNVAQKSDLSIIFMPRTEVLCAVCDCHLGHVFNDGPRPTGLRYCMNSVSMSFKPNKK